MKRFVKTAAAFCLVLAAVLILADYPLSRSMREVHTFGMDTWRDIFEGKAGADILIQGDSRAFNACDQAVFDSLTGLTAYNLTTIGNPFLMQEFRYGMYRGHNRKPRVILQFTDEFFLGTAISDYDRVQYLPWMWDKSFTGGLLSVSRRLFLQNAFPVLRYHGYRPWSLAREPRMTRNGFYLPDYELFRDSVFHHPAEPERAFYYSGYMHDRLTRFLRDASEEGIRVVLVSPPLHESLAFEEGGKEEMVRFFRSVADTCGVPFLDGTSMAIVHDSTCFLDRGHLNMKGARIFSDTLARYLNGLHLSDN